MSDQFRDIQDWATTGGGEGDPAQSEPEIETYVDTFFDQLGTLTDNPADIPGSATARPRGAFTDYNDMFNYLQSGGLTAFSGGGGLIPNPIVYILKQDAPGSDKIIYEVWIDDETP